MYHLISNHLTALRKQKVNGNQIKIPVSPTKISSDSINPTRTPKKPQLLFEARQDTKRTQGEGVHPGKRDEYRS